MTAITLHREYIQPPQSSQVIEFFVSEWSRAWSPSQTTKGEKICLKVQKDRNSYGTPIWKEEETGSGQQEIESKMWSKEEMV